MSRVVGLLLLQRATIMSLQVCGCVHMNSVVEHQTGWFNDSRLQHSWGVVTAWSPAGSSNNGSETVIKTKKNHTRAFQQPGDPFKRGTFSQDS